MGHHLVRWSQTLTEKYHPKGTFRSSKLREVADSPKVWVLLSPRSVFTVWLMFLDSGQRTADSDAKWLEMGSWSKHKIHRQCEYHVNKYHRNIIYPLVICDSLLLLAMAQSKFRECVPLNMVIFHINHHFPMIFPWFSYSKWWFSHEFFGNVLARSGTLNSQSYKWTMNSTTHGP